MLFANLASFAMYLWVDSVLWLCVFWAAMAAPRGAMGAWSHHHQHVHVFRSTALNRLLELGHAFQTGITTHLWVLHHVLGHHLHYLDQTRDESRWARRDGSQMRMLEYVLSVTFTSYWRAYQVGKRHPKYLPAYLFWAGVTLAILVGLVWYRPVPALLVFVGPMVTSLMWVVWATYDHHAGLPTEDQWGASYNIENRLYNLISCNLGYHTAHHHRPAVHWSKLPKLHAKIRHKIPEHLFVRSTFDRFLKDG